MPSQANCNNTSTSNPTSQQQHQTAVLSQYTLKCPSLTPQSKPMGWPAINQRQLHCHNVSVSSAAARSISAALQLLSASTCKAWATHKAAPVQLCCCTADCQTSDLSSLHVSCAAPASRLNAQTARHIPCRNTSALLLHADVRLVRVAWTLIPQQIVEL
jgi:hypothetical protein